MNGARLAAVYGGLDYKFSGLHDRLAENFASRTISSSVDLEYGWFEPFSGHFSCCSDSL
jgi:hypothetical protein